MWRLKTALSRLSYSKEDESTTESKHERSKSLPSPPSSFQSSAPAASRPSTATTSSRPVSASAASTVLRTPELIEMILMHLSMQELLPIQRTSHAVRDIILSSALLKRKLFLAPALAESTDQETDNPFLKNFFPTLGTYLLTGNPKWRPKFIKALSEDEMERIGEEFWECETASWKGMFLTQPPVKEMTLYAGLEEGKGGGSVKDLVNAQVSIKAKDGVTMGMVVDASVKARRKARCGDVRRNDSGYASLKIDEVGGDDVVAKVQHDEISVAVVEIDPMDGFEIEE
ncbi:hypothetical protein BLS_004215 [Venturia inaequalis]|uniref:F-box domain-containing protein n=1 Tax=Venturia inaequalis TaxID=5025 RepID=A0A8H3UM73_VENIN|nr:hypothetical protein BLS_004215 [Venturia inaequalis]